MQSSVNLQHSSTQSRRRGVGLLVGKLISTFSQASTVSPWIGERIRPCSALKNKALAPMAGAECLATKVHSGKGNAFGAVLSLE